MVMKSSPLRWQSIIPLLVLLVFGRGMVVVLLQATRWFPGNIEGPRFGGFTFLSVSEYRAAALVSSLVGVAVGIASASISLLGGWSARYSLSAGARMLFCLTLFCVLVVGYYPRIIALRDLAGRHGPLNFIFCRLAGDPIGYSIFAEICGQLLWTVPMGTVLITLDLEKCSETGIQVARNLGAGFWASLYWLGRPLSYNAQLMVFAMAFSFSICDTAANTHLNGMHHLTVAGMIDAFSYRLNPSQWVAGASLLLVALQILALAALSSIGVLLGKVRRHREQVRYNCYIR